MEKGDFCAGEERVEANLNLIEGGLYLGNFTAATDKHVLLRHRIDRILTVDSCPLPQMITDLHGISCMFVQVTDQPHEDLLGNFDKTCNFIQKAQEDKCTILVHCYHGVSRSATVVIAFIMRKYQLPFKESFDRVNLQRFVSPNPGFELQLQLYERMRFTIDCTNLQYKVYRLKLAARKIRKVKILPLDCVDVFQPDPSLIQVSPDPLVYRCRKCRRIVASAANLLPHTHNQKPSWNDSSWPDNLKYKPLCTATYFVEPMDWMKSALQSEQGKLYCPKCCYKLGSFSWTRACQCPCGAKMSPMFYLVPSTVDWSNIVQNVQVTV